MKASILYALFAALLTALAITAAPALAEPVNPAQARHVQVGDLDLSTPAGRDTLRIRLVHAAREACGEPSTSDLVGFRTVRACRARLVGEGMVTGEQLAKARGGSDSKVIIAANR